MDNTFGREDGIALQKLVYAVAFKKQKKKKWNTLCLE